MGRWIAGFVGAALAVTLGCSPAPSGRPPADLPSPTVGSVDPSPEASPLQPRPSGPVLHYVALGDSLASGMGGQSSYADAYRRALQRRTGRPVELTNLARPGWTSGQMLGALQSNAAFRDAVAQADVVTWDIGGNDIIAALLRTATRTCGGGDGLRCMRETSDDFRNRWNAIIEILIDLRKSPDVPLLTFDLYTPFLPPAARTDELLGQLAAMNATIRASHGRSGVAVAPVARAFTGASEKGLLADDGLHPSRAGHRLIARLLLRLGLPSKG